MGKEKGYLRIFPAIIQIFLTVKNILGLQRPFKKWIDKMVQALLSCVLTNILAVHIYIEDGI